MAPKPITDSSHPVLPRVLFCMVLLSAPENLPFTEVSKTAVRTSMIKRGE